jgi:hypothetical protein
MKKQFGEMITGKENRSIRRKLAPVPLRRRIILKWIFKEQEEKIEVGFAWLRTGSRGRLFWMLLWTFGFHKSREFLEWLIDSTFKRRSCAMDVGGSRMSFIFL